MNIHDKDNYLLSQTLGILKKCIVIDFKNGISVQNLLFHYLSYLIINDYSSLRLKVIDIKWFQELFLGLEDLVLNNFSLIMKYLIDNPKGVNLLTPTERDKYYFELTEIYCNKVKNLVMNYSGINDLGIMGGVSGYLQILQRIDPNLKNTSISSNVNKFDEILDDINGADHYKHDISFAHGLPSLLLVLSKDGSYGVRENLKIASINFINYLLDDKLVSSSLPYWRNASPKAEAMRFTWCHGSYPIICSAIGLCQELKLEQSDHSLNRYWHEGNMFDSTQALAVNDGLCHGYGSSLLFLRLYPKCIRERYSQTIVEQSIRFIFQKISIEQIRAEKLSEDTILNGIEGIIYVLLCMFYHSNSSDSYFCLDLMQNN
ncbi:lanthionine synthetase LanC family protein [Lapidilactobacillus bayanensis]|uniref:lanthionine synthetase LanC family protein n=1 Tax=Lapidilactobacillus bayanensis TaxID=2485998 RepID=UPI000F7B5ED3|nr:lanthionine synthetase LanC family protein [Lapidilactobacillus bayanensis]